MYYGNIKKNDVANGTGVRTALFVSGCRNCCRNCFNPETWDFKYGQEFTKEVADEIIASLAPPHISGLSILGGEPMEPENQKDLLPFVKRVKKEFPDKTIWMYTGYTLETDLLDPHGRKHTEATIDLLKSIDVLVDGLFVEELKDITLKFRGSSNQRIIELKDIELK